MANNEVQIKLIEGSEFRALPDESFVYEESELNFEVTCSIDRVAKTARIRSIRHNILEFEWFNLTESQIEEIQALSGIIETIPERIIDALITNAQNSEDTGVTGIQTIIDQLTEYCTEHYLHRCPALSASFKTLSFMLRMLQNSLNTRSEQEIGFASEMVINKIDSIHTACHLFIEFLHKELVKTINADPSNPQSRNEYFSQAVQTFLPVSDNFHLQPSLKYKFIEIGSRNVFTRQLPFSHEQPKRPKS
jgi:hypothetical protein